MTDPHSELDVFIQDILTLQHKNHNDHYRFGPAQALKTAADKYRQNPNKDSFMQLINAITGILPYISNSRVINLTRFQSKINEIANKHYQMEPINWQENTGRTRTTTRVTVGFRFTSISHSGDSLLPWLNTIISRDFVKLNGTQQTQVLIECYAKYDGFSTALKRHLDVNPDFLVKLALNSEENFIKIAQSRLNLFLDDQQMATIMKEHWLDRSQVYSFEVMDQLLNKMASVLSYGRTIAKLLENPNVQEYLRDTPFLNFYQREDYKHHLESTPSGVNPSPNR